MLSSSLIMAAYSAVQSSKSSLSMFTSKLRRILTRASFLAITARIRAVHSNLSGFNISTHVGEGRHRGYIKVPCCSEECSEAMLILCL